MSSTPEPKGITHTHAGSDRYALTLVISAKTADEAYDFVTDTLRKPHPWEGPCSAAFVGDPLEIDYQEEYDSDAVALAVLQNVPPMTRDQRAHRLLAAHPEYRGADREAVVDAITDLLHFAKGLGEDFDSVVASAELHLDAESDRS